MLFPYPSTKTNPPTASSSTTTTPDADVDPQTAALNSALETLIEVFPHVEVDEFRHLLETLSEESRLFVITDMILRRNKDGGVPRRRIGAKLEGWEMFRTAGYREAARALLNKEFKGLSKSTIKAVMAEHNHSYPHTRHTLSTIATKSWRFSLSSFFRGTRLPTAPPTAPTGNPTLDAELFALAAPARDSQIASDRAMARLLNEAEHATADALVECECCYGTYPWDETAVCAADPAHFFCHACLLRSVQEGLYGQGRNLVPETCSVRCLSSSADPPCEAFVAPDLLQRVLPEDVLRALEEKTAAESLDRCGLSLVKCPFCPYAEVAEEVTWRVRRVLVGTGGAVGAAVAAAVVAPRVLVGVLLGVVLAVGLALHVLPQCGVVAATGRVARAAGRIAAQHRGKLFRCGARARCGRESCIECGKEWLPFHKCFEQESDSVRIFVEKAMADAVKRTCPRCNISFIKSDGCNKLTCPCGYTMCYVCRADIGAAGYTHFCQHFRQDPGTACGECDACNLYVAEDEAGAIRRAAEAAEREYLRRWGRRGADSGWVYRRAEMGGSVLGSEVMAGVKEVEEEGGGWGDVLDGWVGRVLEGVLEVEVEGRWVVSCESSSLSLFWERLVGAVVGL
ncbi:uncharacterized protein H6S33_001679 [Morchella sextelata]|uniref:uncharacterized protein n=1 Tax=Morchella sextelata TaxID=1174677 RepID=UPI001D038D0E|nr:uncharacterized protein H6S33_001679 [Morchella sextelata]KAH0608545.1 hypothetical protein H6S33_001679 [Morchella sextelata]